MPVSGERLLGTSSSEPPLEAKQLVKINCFVIVLLLFCGCFVGSCANNSGLKPKPRPRPTPRPRPGLAWALAEARPPWASAEASAEAQAEAEAQGS